MTILELNKKFRSIFGFNVPIDMILTMSKGPTNARIDIIKLDEELDKHDPEYNSAKCMYKGQRDVSMKYYVELKYGNDAVDFLNKNI